ncbi:MAG: transcription termination/antitermination protein NusA [Elusimicrobia bacterium]|nr:transcription termination/antitermination protein NusA [Elusimicrobiota bacterium]
MSQSKSEFILLLETIEKDKGIPRQEILRLIEGALVSALHKHLGREVPVQATMDAETGEMRAAVVKKVVKQVSDPVAEISAEQAKKLGLTAELEAECPVLVDTTEFSRIAAQTAKQVILQKLREVEKENLFKDFKKKESLVVTGSVYRYGQDKTVYVSLGKIEAILKKEDQIPGERFAIGYTIKALVRAVELSVKGPQVYLSRSSAEFVKSLLRLEVPEVHDGTVEVLKVAREPGFRSKVLVKSSNPRVDPVGACVGIKGTRIKPVINELHGEKIDLIPFSDKVGEMLAASLAPAKVVKIELEDHDKKTAHIYAAQDQVAGAIGKDGLNLKLAIELSGWNMTIEQAATEPVQPVAPPAAEPIPSPSSATEGSEQ